MKHERRIPAWLLRDLPALAGMFSCFWLFVIPLITEGFRIIRGGKPDQKKFDALAEPLLAAEATLAYALWREACRRLGYNPKLVKLELADLPTDNIALMARIRSYMDQVQNLSRAAAHYTDILRRRWSAASAHAAHASTDAAPRAAATQVLAGVARLQGALMLSSAHSARPSKHERVLVHARGPPTFHRLPIANCLLPRKRQLSGTPSRVTRSATRSDGRDQSPHPRPPTRSQCPSATAPAAPASLLAC